MGRHIKKLKSGILKFDMAKAKQFGQYLMSTSDESLAAKMWL